MKIVKKRTHQQTLQKNKEKVDYIEIFYKSRANALVSISIFCLFYVFSVWHLSAQFFIFLCVLLFELNKLLTSTC